MSRAAELAVPELGSRCTIDVAEPDGRLRRIVAAGPKLLGQEEVGDVFDTSEEARRALNSETGT